MPAQGLNEGIDRYLWIAFLRCGIGPTSDTKVPICHRVMWRMLELWTCCLPDVVVNPPPVVSVVDDDESIRESLPALLREMGFSSRAFPSAEAFLSSRALDDTQCLVLDIAMPGMSGPDLLRELKRLGLSIPIVFITGHGDNSVRPRMLTLGAVECLFKPFSDTALLGAINVALGASASR